MGFWVKGLWVWGFRVWRSSGLGGLGGRGSGFKV